MSDLFFALQVYRKYGKEYGEKTNPNISYQFYLPTRDSDWAIRAPKGKWIVFTTPCSVSCGLGEEVTIMSQSEKHKKVNTTCVVLIHFAMLMGNLFKGVPKAFFLHTLSFLTGVQKHVSTCVDDNTNRHLEEHNCETPPPSTPLHAACQLSPCPPRLGSYSSALLFYFELTYKYCIQYSSCIAGYTLYE